MLSKNPSAKELLLKNKDKIKWDYLVEFNYRYHPDEFRDLVKSNLDKINFNLLSSIPDAVQFLETNQDKINWNRLSRNPNAIHLLEKNLDKINWQGLSGNPNAIHLLEKNLDKVNWNLLCENPNAIHILKKYYNNILWFSLTFNKNGIQLFYSNVKNLDKHVWIELCSRENAIDLLIEHYDYIKSYGKYLLWNKNSPKIVLKLDYKKMSELNQSFTEELVSVVFHPKRLLRICNEYNIKFEDIHDIY
jgi:hypothetical protein